MWLRVFRVILVYEGAGPGKSPITPGHHRREFHRFSLDWCSHHFPFLWISRDLKIEKITSSGEGGDRKTLSLNLLGSDSVLLPHPHARV